MIELSTDDLLEAYVEAEEVACETSRLERVVAGERWGEEVFLAEGGGKRIYLTYDQTSGRELVKAYPKDETQYNDFIKEARLHSLLEHASIASIYEMGVEGGSALLYHAILA